MDRVLFAVVVVFGAVILAAAGRSIQHLLTLAHPDPGFGYYVYDDALQVYSGHWPYQDPSVGYVGLLYPPLYPTFLAGLMHLRLWSGWGLMVSELAALTLAGMVAAVAYRQVSGSASKAWRVIEAGAFGLIGGWLVTVDPALGVFGGGPDTFAWAIGIGGLLLVPQALSGSWRWSALVIVLLSAAFWAKQPASVPALAAGVWAVLASVLGIIAWRRAVAFIGGLAVVNLAVLGLLALATDGWAYFYIFVMGRRHSWEALSYGEILQRSLEVLWLPLAFAAAMAIIGTVAHTRVSRRTLRGWSSALAVDRDAQRFVLFLLFTSITTPLEIYFQRKQGSGLEHLLGPLWGLIFLSAAGWRWAGRTGAGRVAAGLVVAAVALLAVGIGDRPDKGMDQVPKVFGTIRPPTVPKELVSLARHRTVYEQRIGDIGMSAEHVPLNSSVCDLGAAGLSSPALERDLANRRYDLMLAFIVPDDYCAGYGKWEENYFWKLNRVIDAGYRLAPPRLPTPVMERRPGPAAGEAARRLLRCFAPYRLAGVLFRIGQGGGFWCQANPTDPRLTLGDIPASDSEVLTDGVVTSIDGALLVSLPEPSGTVQVTAEGEGGSTIVASLHAGALRPRGASFVLATSRRQTPAVRRALAAGAALKTLDPDQVIGRRLALTANLGSRVRLDFSGMTIRAKDGYERGRVTRRGLTSG